MTDELDVSTPRIPTSPSSLWRRGKGLPFSVQAFMSPKDVKTRTAGHPLRASYAETFHSPLLSPPPTSDQTSPTPLYHRLSQHVIHNADNESEKLKETIRLHEAKIAEMNEKLVTVSGERDRLARSNERLRRLTSSQQSSLHSTIRLTQQRLQEQTSLLTQQYTIIQGLVSERHEESSLLDLVCVVVSVYIVRTPVMEYTLRLVTRYAGSPRHAWILRLLKYATILQTYSFLKRFLIKARANSRVLGTCQWLLNRSISAVSRLMTTVDSSLSESEPQEGVTSLALC